ncbi:glycosyltransferase family 4 protein [Parasphingorhabdus sp.]|uniref:glycosyltransferase family 4 protein n=1 Tax=Parasphingorhabdus sp. TaxID=2709688 RepID=UPI003BB05AF2
MTLHIIVVGMLSFFLTVALVSKGGRLANKLGLIDLPGGRKKHLHPTPLMGGLTILFIIAPLMIAYTLIYPYYFQNAIIAIASVGTLIAGLAIFDDRVHIPAFIRLIISALFFGVAMWFIPGLQIGTVSWSGGTEYLSLGRFTIILTVLSLVAFINAINMADGKNGLVTGLCFGFSLILLVSARANLGPIIAILTGATLALFIFNLRGQIFLGDGGSYGLAAFIGLFSIYVYQRSDLLVSADQIGLMFMVPVGDMGRLMITRIRERKSPFEPDRNHLHHLLQDWIGWRKGLLVYWCMIFVPAIIAIILPWSSWILILLSIATYFTVFLFCKQSKAKEVLLH